MNKLLVTLTLLAFSSLAMGNESELTHFAKVLSFKVIKTNYDHEQPVTQEIEVTFLQAACGESLDNLKVEVKPFAKDVHVLLVKFLNARPNICATLPSEVTQRFTIPVLPSGTTLMSLTPIHYQM